MPILYGQHIIYAALFTTVLLSTDEFLRRLQAYTPTADSVGMGAGETSVGTMPPFVPYNDRL